MVQKKNGHRTLKKITDLCSLTMKKQIKKQNEYTETVIISKVHHTYFQ